MRRSASQLGPDAELRAQVAVVGAGPMGIVVALELARAGHHVLLLESGTHRFDPAIQALSDQADEGADVLHAPGRLAVRRQVGGTSVTWGGRCVPFDRIDFEPRPAVPQRLWPVTYDEFAAYLPRACDWCACGRPLFDVGQVPELATRPLVPGLRDDEVRSNRLERWALPTRFGKRYRRELDRHPLVDLVTGATVTAIACTADGTGVDHLEVRSPGGGRVTARADHYVLATGGLEATRLLLASDAAHPGGIGNHSGHLGRWYMAHVTGRVARVQLTTPPDQTIHGHERDADGVYVRRRFTFSEELQRRTGLPNAATWFVNPDLGDAAHGSGILSGSYLTLISPLGRFVLAEALREKVTRTSRRSPVRAHLRNIADDLGPSARFAVTFTWSRFLRRGRKAPGFFVRSPTNTYLLDYHGEHRPHWESRVELSDERDAFGLPRLRTHVHFDDADIAAVRTAMEHLDRHLRRQGIGWVEVPDDVEAAVWRELHQKAGYHQTGTTRMSSSPDDGVVDPDLRVHGVDNLFVAATSVFPTSSQANPTLTGVAFAVRLADHLRGRLADPGLGTASGGQSVPMPKAVRVAQSGLQGWRAKVADQVADPVSSRTPLSAEQVRAAVGGVFVVLSALYLFKTAKAATQEFKR